MTPELWTALAVAIVGSGGIATWLKVRADRPTTVALQHATVLNDMQELNDILKEDLRAAREDSALLRKEVLELRQQVSVLRARVRSLEQGAG